MLFPLRVVHIQSVDGLSSTKTDTPLAPHLQEGILQQTGFGLQLHLSESHPTDGGLAESPQSWESIPITRLFLICTILRVLFSRRTLTNVASPDPFSSREPPAAGLSATTSGLQVLRVPPSASGFLLFATPPPPRWGHVDHLHMVLLHKNRASPGRLPNAHTCIPGNVLLTSEVAFPPHDGFSQPLGEGRHEGHRTAFSKGIPYFCLSSVDP